MIGLGELTEWFGQIDVYLFDQLLRGRVQPSMRVLDAGCGEGRNLVYLMRAGCDAYGVDCDEKSIAGVRELASEIAPRLPPQNFRVEAVESMSFPDGYFDFVVANALLHFAEDESQFAAMLREMWRVLAPEGIFFARLATTIGLEDRLRPLGGSRFALPDGQEWLLVDERFLVAATKDLGGVLLDPIKTTNVQNRRCMTTWCVRKVVPG